MSVMMPAALTGAQYEIAGGDYLAIVTEMGAGLRALLHRDRPLVTAYEADELPLGGAGLLPALCAVTLTISPELPLSWYSTVSSRRNG